MVECRNVYRVLAMDGKAVFVDADKPIVEIYYFKWFLGKMTLWCGQ